MSTARNPFKNRSWRFWLILAVNVAGLLVAIPLLKLAVPLAAVWWHTRSQESLREYRETVSDPAQPNQPEIPGASAAADTQALQNLTNQLGAVEHLSQAELGQIVSQHFGTPTRMVTNSNQFDMPSAVFSSITRTSLVVQGKTYYGYQVDLVDQNGNHQTNIDCFPQPNLEYERSLAALELINRSPQLKRIYQAMASSLAEKSSNSTNAPEVTSDGPAFRFQPASVQPQP